MKKFVIGIISFLLTILLILTIVLTTYNFTINSKDYLLNTLEKNDFYPELRSAIDDHFEEYVLQSGLPEDIFVGLVTNEFLRNMVTKNVDIFYAYVHGKSSTLEINLDTTNLQNALITRINNFINENNIVLDSEGQKSIDEYLRIVFEPFSLNDVINNGLDTAANYLQKINDLYRIAMGCIIIVVVILTVLLFVLYKNLISSLTCTLAVIFSSAIIIRVVSEILLRNKIINDFYIFSIYFSNAIVSYIQGIFNILILITNIVFAVVIVLFIALLLFGKRKSKIKY